MIILEYILTKNSQTFEDAMRKRNINLEDLVEQVTKSNDEFLVLNGLYILLNYVYMKKINPIKPCFSNDRLYNLYLDFSQSLFINSKFK